MTLQLDSIVADIRKRHGLADDAKVGIGTVSADMKVDDRDPLVFTATITKNVIDRDDEVVMPSGMMGAEFDKSGAVFWNHNHGLPVAIPFGKVTKDGESITSKARFMERPMDYSGDFFPDFARAFVTQMAAMGKRPGVSIGFIEMERRQPTTKDKERYGEKIRNVITRWKLLEWSIAPVQSNPEAYVTAVGKSIGAKACKALFGVEPVKEKGRSPVFVEIVMPKAKTPVSRREIEEARRMGLTWL